MMDHENKRARRGLIPLLQASAMMFAGLWLLVGPAHAQRGIPEDGVSGFVSVIPGGAHVTSQFLTDSKNQVNTSLSSSGESIGTLVPLVPFEIAYMKSDWNMQFHAGIPSENLREGDLFMPEVGVRYWLSDATRLSASVVLPSLVTDETWSDPFLLNAVRQETDVVSLGFNLRADNIAGSRWGIRYTYLNWDVENELSGQSVAGLTASQLQSLDRDADVHRLTGTYAIPLEGGWWLRPALRFTWADAEGDSNSYQALRPELGIVYFEKHYDFSLNLYYSNRWFDADNPVFGQARDSQAFAATAAFGIKEVFNLKYLRMDFIGSYRNEESDIGFYDNEAIFGGGGFTYEF